jgi:hypothetical protein
MENVNHAKIALLANSAIHIIALLTVNVSQLLVQIQNA